jgi:nitroreductase
MNRDSFFNATLVLVFYSLGPESALTAENAAGAWCCIENMLLSAVNEGLGAKISYFLDEEAKKIKKLIKVPHGWELATAICIGIPAEEPSPRRLRPEGSWLHRNHF